MLEAEIEANMDGYQIFIPIHISFMHQSELILNLLDYHKRRNERNILNK